MKKDKKNLLWAVIAGSVVGSVTALLFAPKPGKELRKEIVDGTASTLEKAQEIATQASEKSVELYSKAKDTVEQVVHEVREWNKQCTCDEEAEDKLAVSGITTEDAIIAFEAEAEAEADADADADADDISVADKDDNDIL